MHPDIYYGLPEAEYRGGVGVSKSDLDLVSISPAHFREEKDNPTDKDTKAKAYGRALHCSILEPERYAMEYACDISPDDFENCLVTTDEIKARIIEIISPKIESIGEDLFDIEKKQSDLNEDLKRRLHEVELEIVKIKVEDFETKKAYNEALKPFKEKLKNIKSDSKSKYDELNLELKEIKSRESVLKSNLSGKKSDIIESLQELDPSAVIFDVEKKKHFAKHVGKNLLDKDTFVAIQRTTEKFKSHPFSNIFLTEHKTEGSMYWNDPETGELCRGRFDLSAVSDGVHFLVDMKSTEDASYEGFLKSVKKWRYHVQDAHYSDGHKILTGHKPVFIFMCYEKKPPFEVGIHRLDDDWKELGKRLRDEDLAKFSKCKKENKWPGYPQIIQTLEFPNYLKPLLERLREAQESA
jgi:exodeoxyribonuclease VIII